MSSSEIAINDVVEASPPSDQVDLSSTNSQKEDDDQTTKSGNQRSSRKGKKGRCGGKEKGKSRTVSHEYKWSKLKIDFRCQICFQIFLDPVSLPCGHSFCGGCFEKYSRKSSRPECPACRGKFNSDSNFTTNVVLRDLLLQMGGSRYERYIENRRKSETIELLEGKYKSSHRYGRIENDLYKILEDQPGIEWSELKKSLSQWPEIELKYHLGDMTQKGYLISINEKLIVRHNILTYVNCQADQLSSAEIIYLLTIVCFKKLNKQVKEKINDSRFKNADGSLTRDQSRWKLESREWRHHLEKINVELLTGSQKKCLGCSNFHDEDDDEDYASYEYSYSGSE